MTEGRISPVKVLRSPRLVIVAKFVITTSSFGIIISERSRVNTRFLPLNSRRANAKAAGITIMSMRAVVTTVKIIVLMKYLARGTAEKACA